MVNDRLYINDYINYVELNACVYSGGKVLNRAIQEYHHPRNRAKRYRALVKYTLHIDQPSYYFDLVPLERNLLRMIDTKTLVPNAINSKCHNSINRPK